MTKEQIREELIKNLPDYKSMPANPGDKTESVPSPPTPTQRLGLGAMESADRPAEDDDLPVAPTVLAPRIPDSAPHMQIVQTEQGEFHVICRPFTKRRKVQGLDGAGHWRDIYEIAAVGGKFRIAKRIYTKVRIVQIEIQRYQGGIEDTRLTPLQTEDL